MQDASDQVIGIYLHIAPIFNTRKFVLIEAYFLIQPEPIC